MLVTGVVGVWIDLQIGGARVTLWVDDLATPLVASVACVSCLGARARHVGRMRLFWSLLACATASWTLAEAVWGFYALILNVEVPVPSWADVGYLTAIPLAVAALVVHPATRGSGTRKVRSLFDGLVVATSLLLLSWTVVLGPLARIADLSTSTGVVTLAYPFGDVVIVFFIVRAIRGMTSANRLSLCCLLPVGCPAGDGAQRQHLQLPHRGSEVHGWGRDRYRLGRGVSRDRARRLQLVAQRHHSVDRRALEAIAGARPQRPSRPDAQAYPFGSGWQTPRGDTVTRPPDWWL